MLYTFVKKLTFKKLIVQNFLSVGNDPVVVDFQSGINAIVGANLDKEDSRNGAGKSTILCALHFALYGDPIREIAKTQISNSITKKGALVSLELEVNQNGQIDVYTINRSLNPSQCSIYKNKHIDQTLSTIVKCNLWIECLLHTPSVVFKNSVVLSLNHSLPFLALSKVDRRKYVESILNLHVLAAMAQMAKESYNQNHREYELTYKEQKTLDESYQFNQKQWTTFQEKRKILEDKLQDLQESQKHLQIPLEERQKNQKKLTKIQEVRKELQEEIQHLQGILSVSNQQSNKILQNIQELKKSTSCPTCKRAFEASTVDAIRQQLQSLETEHQEIQSQIQQNQANIQSQRKQLEDLEALEIPLLEKESNWKQAEIQQKSLQQQIQQQKEMLEQWDLSTLEEETQKQQKRLGLLQESIEVLNKELTILDQVKYILSEKGVKSFLVKKILHLLNARIEYYLQKLQSNAKVSLDEWFDPYILDEHQEEKSYFNFSGGERKRIDFACMFAFADIRRIQGDVVFSHVFYDELLDTSLDDKGIELVLDILQERQYQYQENCYIVTHRTAEISARADHVITLQKRNGCTILSNS